MSVLLAGRSLLSNLERIPMLSLKVREGERVRIMHAGVECWVYLWHTNGSLRLVFDAPREFQIDREKVAQSKDAELGGES